MKKTFLFVLLFFLILYSGLYAKGAKESKLNTGSSAVTVPAAGPPAAVHTPSQPVNVPSPAPSVTKTVPVPMSPATTTPKPAPAAPVAPATVYEDYRCDVNAWNEGFGQNSDPRNQSSKQWDGHDIIPEEIYMSYPKAVYIAPSPTRRYRLQR